MERTCDVGEIGAFLARPLLVLSTYDSLSRLAEGAEAAGASLELCVFDEAHFMAGRGRKFGVGLDEDAKLPVRQRLFLTGTRVFVDRVAGGAKAEEEDGEKRWGRSMDDEATFGPTA